MAIIGEDQPDMAALLTARLGREPGVQLLERDEVQRIVQEHALPKNAAEDSPALGKLLGADYLIFLEGVKEAAGESVQARVVWCEPGAVLASITLPNKIEATRRADWLGERIIPWLHKASVQDVRRISLLGLRCITDSAENELLERELNAALSARLEGDPGFVVLERWHMDDLVFEKSVNNITDSPFWLAADVVDGAITPSKDKIKVHIRVRNPAGSGTTTDIQCEGTPGALPALADSIAKQLEKNPLAASIVGNGKQEAQAFCEESDWLMTQALPEEALQAIESAWALGKHDNEALADRVLAYATVASPYQVVCEYENGSGYSNGAIASAQMPRSIQLTCQALYLTGDYMVAHGATRSSPRQPIKVEMSPPEPAGMSWWLDPIVMGRLTLFLGLRVLWDAYQTGFYLENPGPVAELRQAIRDNIDLLQNLTPGKPKGLFLAYLAQYAAYWNETPAEAIAFYRDILARPPATMDPDWPWYIRSEMVSNHQVPVIDWSKADQSDATRAWNAYQDELLHANDPLERADAMMFKYLSLTAPAQQTAFLPKVVDFLVAPSSGLATADGPAIVAALGPPLRSLDLAARSRLLGCCIDLLQEPKPLPGVIDLLSLLTSVYANNRTQYTRDDAARLSAALRGHAARLPAPVDPQYAEAVASCEAHAVIFYPDLAGHGSAHALRVTRLWAAQQYAPGPGQFDPAGGFWRDGCLTVASSGPDRRICRIHLPDFKTEEIDASFGPPTPIATSFGDSIALPDKSYEASDDSVWVISRGDSKRSKLDLPASQYRLAIGEGALWAAFRDGQGWVASGIYRIDLKTDEATLLCSTRRHPPTCQLDAREGFYPFCMLPTGTGWPILGNAWNGGVYFYHTDTGARWEKLLYSNCGAFSRPYDAGSLVCETRSGAPMNGVLCGVVRVTNQGHYDPLIWNSKFKPAAEGTPLWNFPPDCGVNVESGVKYLEAYGSKYFCPAMSGNDFYLLTGRQAVDTATSAMRVSAEAVLYCFRSGNRNPVTIPLAFGADGIASHPLPGNDAAMLAIPAGLVINGTGSAFWFIPRADIEAAIAAAEK